MFNQLTKLSTALISSSVLILSGCGSTQEKPNSHGQRVGAYKDVRHQQQVSGDLTKNIPITYTPRVFRKSSPFGTPITVQAEVLNRSFKNKDSISKFGGSLDRTYPATGYFYTSFIDERWWLIDPKGHPMVTVGLNSVESIKSPQNTIKMMKVMGFNSTGAFSKANIEKTKNRLSRTPKLKCMESFGSEFYDATSNGNNHDFENKVIPVLDPRFEEYCFKKLNATVKSSAIDDPYIIGYYVDNELPWNLDSLDRTLTLSKENISKAKAEAWLAQNGGTINAQTRRKFLYFIADKYYAIVKKALKKAAPNHLYLGSRLHSSYKTNEDIVRASGKYVDVLSVNFYGPWKPDESHFSLWKKWTNKPVIISEWYTKSADTGLPNASGAGHVVATQLDRGNYYQDFSLALLKSDIVVGWSWHRFIDQKPGPVGATSNKGLFDKNGGLYLDLAEKAETINNHIYQIIDHYK